MKAINKKVISGRLCTIFVVCIFLFTGCKKDDKKVIVAPMLTTSAATNITTTTARSGGIITNDGGSAITEAGIVYSKSNAIPTATDTKLAATVAGGSVTVDVVNLDPGSTYYIRAYAINSAGTGYGDVKSFVTGNAAPQARNITVTPSIAQLGTVMTVAYTYFDFENDPQSGTTIQWYVANDSIGGTVSPIAGATAATFTLTDAEKDRFLFAGITPKSSGGTMVGTEAKSYWVSAIRGEEVTFTYNKQTVTYGVITSSTTGRKWMDRNLGAKRAATSIHDHLAYGDLFQWGRGADGHQLINWTQDSPLGSSAPVNGITSVLSATDMPGHPLFIITNLTEPNDWRDPQNNARWQAPDYINNPCPAGWRIPNNGEWDAENIDIMDRNQLKITAASARRLDNGNLQDGSLGPGRHGDYWSSTVTLGTDGNDYYTEYYFILNVDFTLGRPWGSFLGEHGASGYSCRCIKNL